MSDIRGVRIGTALLQEKLPETLFDVNLCREGKKEVFDRESVMQLSNFKALGTLFYMARVHARFI